MTADNAAAKANLQEPGLLPKAPARCGADLLVSSALLDPTGLWANWAARFSSPLTNRGVRTQPPRSQ